MSKKNNAGFSNEFEYYLCENAVDHSLYEDCMLTQYSNLNRHNDFFSFGAIILCLILGKLYDKNTLLV